MRGLCIEKETATKLMHQFPFSGKAPTPSKLLPYDASLSDIFSADVESGKFRCKLCDKTLSSKTTRRHVGMHILSDNLSNVCGFCGLPGCLIGIACGSGCGKIISSNCDYKVKFSLKAATWTTKTSPCANQPVSCQIYKSIFWS